MHPIENESTLRYLRKKHKDWSEEKIKAEAKKIWDKYVEDNKTVLEDKAKLEKKLWEECLDKEFVQLYLDSLDNL
jgi:hypothetical protein